MSRHYDIEGHGLTYPTRFRDGSSMMGLFVVPTAAVGRLVHDSGFTPAEVLPRRTVVSLNCVHYTDTDCGAYEEIALAVFVQPHGADGRAGHLSTWRSILNGSVASYAWRLAVTTTLSRDCGLRMWGFPKTVQDLRWDHGDGRATMTWSDGGNTVLAYSVPATGRRRPTRISPPVYSVFEGRPHVGRLTQSYSGVGYHLRGARLDLGDHPVADELRMLGLPRRPLMAMWNAHLDFTMSAPEQLD